ncbi:MAG: hypothetical protein M3Z46_00650, partial [Actinomycetota bacterium]|nr:hypothetical protein [Actinomycetota bacterium]
SDITLYVVALVVVGAAFTLLEPRWWSLHILYRARLRDAFASTVVWSDAARWIREAHGESDDAQPTEPLAPVWPLPRRGERRIDEFAEHGKSATGPAHLICCTAARRPRTGTGIRGESFVIAPDEVTLYESTENGTVRERSAATEDYTAALSPRARTESMWVALSGAAVAPAMGRMTRGTLGTLFAVLNVRLGVWMPNPTWIRPGAGADRARHARYPRAAMPSLAKEIAGAWSVDDMHLYITDGGHWDNLGLVELLRRRCRTIICVDAAGDTPGTHATLRQAAQLAELQVMAKIIDVPDPEPIDAAPQDPAYRLLTVQYNGPDGSPEACGTIIYLQARVWPSADLSLRAYAAEDPLFPNYSTGNQLLSERQFRHMVDLGRCAAEQALGAKEVREAVSEGLGTRGPVTDA